MDQQSWKPPPLTEEKIHGQDEKGKYVMVEDSDVRCLKLTRRKAYFHERVAPSDFKSRFVHPEVPLDYYSLNSWETPAGQKPPEIGATPEGVEYTTMSEEEFKAIPHMAHLKGKAEEKIAGIDLANQDDLWLYFTLRISVVRQLMPGRSGFYYGCTVQQIPGRKTTGEFSGDRQRITMAARDQFEKKPLVLAKLYFTYGMSKPEQMERLYQETLAHVELNGHPNIVNTYAVRFKMHKGKPNDDGDINAIDPETDLHSNIVMEYSNVGSFAMMMKSIVIRSKHHVEHRDFSYYFLYLKDVVLGLAHLHSTGRAHREFNYTNCLAVRQKECRLKKKEEPEVWNCVIKLCDFAYTKKFSDEENQLRRAWQSMDVMDLGRMLLWHIKQYLLGKHWNDFRFELQEIAEFLMVDGVEQRLENFNKLVAVKEQEGTDVREFFKGVVEKPEKKE